MILGPYRSQGKGLLAPFSALSEFHLLVALTLHEGWGSYREVLPVSRTIFTIPCPVLHTPLGASRLGVSCCSTLQILLLPLRQYAKLIGRTRTSLFPARLSSMTSHGPPVWLVRSVLICRIPFIIVEGMADCVTNAEVTYQFALHPTGLAHLTRLGSRANEPLSVLTAR